MWFLTLFFKRIISTIQTKLNNISKHPPTPFKQLINNHMTNFGPIHLIFQLNDRLSVNFEFKNFFQLRKFFFISSIRMRHFDSRIAFWLKCWWRDHLLQLAMGNLHFYECFQWNFFIAIACGGFWGLLVILLLLIWFGCSLNQGLKCSDCNGMKIFFRFWGSILQIKIVLRIFVRSFFFTFFL